MKIRALKTTHGSYGLLKRGDTADISDDEAKGLISQGYAVAYSAPSKLSAAPHNDAAKAEGGKDKGDPFEERQTGGRDGKAKQSSSSQEGRQPSKRQSTSRKDDAE